LRSQKSVVSAFNSDVLPEVPILAAMKTILILSTIQLVIGHSSNDVANPLGPLMIVFDIYKIKDYQPAFLLTTLGICVGLVTLGERVMQTIGKEVIHLDLPKAICA